MSLIAATQIFLNSQFSAGLVEDGLIAPLGAVNAQEVEQ